MKVLVVIILLVVGTAARSTVFETGPKCPIKDPLVTDVGPLNVSLVPILVIEEGGTHEEATFVGFSGLKYEYTINIVTLSAEVDINLTSIDFDCKYADIVGWLNFEPLREETLPSGNFTGSGKAVLSATNINLKAKATLFINLLGNKVGVLLLNIENLTFDTISADLGQEFLLDGSPIDYVKWSAGFRDNFYADFAAFKPQVTENIRLAINGVIGKLTLEELIKLIEDIGTGGDGECDQPIKLSL